MSDWFDAHPPPSLEVRVAAHRLGHARAWYGRFFPALDADVFRVGGRTLVVRAEVRDDDPRGAVIDLAVPDLPAAVEALLAPGAVWLEDILVHPDGGFSTDLIDPLGAVWRLREGPRPVGGRLAAMQALAGRYQGRLSRLGVARATGASPWPVLGRFGHCAEARWDPEAALGPAHVEASGGLRRPGAPARAWRYHTPDGLLVDVECDADGLARLWVDPPDAAGALLALGLDPAPWAAVAAAPPSGPDVLTAAYEIRHLSAEGGGADEAGQVVATAQTDYGARRWVAVLEARLGAQTVWAERLPSG